MPPLAGLHRGVGQDVVDHDQRFHLGQRRARIATAPTLRTNLVQPRMLRRPRRREDHGATDHDELAGLGVPASDHNLRVTKRPQHAANDHLDTVAVLDLSSGSPVRRALSS